MPCPKMKILKKKFFQIFEVKPENKRQIPIGTRVCVYWSRAYNCLFPGTIEELEDVSSYLIIHTGDLSIYFSLEKKTYIIWILFLKVVLDRDNMVQVLLDDGDRRQVDVGSVRMLPQDCAHIGM